MGGFGRGAWHVYSARSWCVPEGQDQCGKEIYLRLGEMTQQDYKGKAFCTRKTVIAVLVDINGNPIDDAMHFFPDGFLCSNMHQLPDDIAGAGIAT